LEKLQAENPDSTSAVAAGALKAGGQSSIMPRRPSMADAAAAKNSSHIGREQILSTSTAFDKNYFTKLTPKNIKRLWRAKYSRDADEDEDGDDEDDQHGAPSTSRAAPARDEEETREYLNSFHAPGGKKVSVPIRIEPKVYFAAERTFLKWLEMSVFISALAVGMINYSKPGDSIGLIVSGLFTIVALMAIAYSGTIYMLRSKKIRRREASNIYFDAYGPTILCGVLLAVTVVNFVLRFRETSQSRTFRGLVN
jgi:uncharacterized membrane protein YidH (DUF202 family)